MIAAAANGHQILKSRGATLGFRNIVTRLGREDGDQVWTPGRGTLGLKDSPILSEPDGLAQGLGYSLFEITGPH